MGKCLSTLNTSPNVTQAPIEISEMVVVERPQLQPQVVKINTPQLQNLDPNTVPKVPLQNLTIDARIVTIYDGDTVKIIVMLGDVPFFISLRLLGADAPEIKKGKDKLPEEHLAAVKVRERIKKMFPTEMAKVVFRDWDKYGGRILGDLFTLENVNVVQLLIKEGWVKEYHGEKKQDWTLEQLTSPPFV